MAAILLSVKDAELLFTRTRPCNIQRFFTAVKMITFQMKSRVVFLIFAQNIDCEAVLTSTHNLCFRAKIRKKCIKNVLLYKSGV